MAGQPSNALLHHPAAQSLPNLPPIPLADTRAVTAALNDLNITEIHTHSLVDFAPESPHHLVALVHALGVRWEANLHDFKVICPRINLVDGNGFYCGEPPYNACDRCLAENGSDFGVTDIRAWRTMHQHALSTADQVLVPDPDAAERLVGYFSDIHFEVSPHEDMNLARIRPALPRLAPDERLRVVVIGAIGKIKGFDVLLACARNAKLRRLPLEFILMGYSINDRRLRQAGVKVTGRYLEENAQDTLKGLSPHMVWLPSVWPETYSYTLSIALKAGLPVAAFDIGAIARRLRQCGLGNGLLPLAMAHRPGDINDCFIKERHSFLPDAEMTQNRCQPQVLRW
jgi:glycosyltransferase involved in cell wall biosynthesis